MSAILNLTNNPSPLLMKKPPRISFPPGRSCNTLPVYRNTEIMTGKECEKEMAYMLSHPGPMLHRTHVSLRLNGLAGGNTYCVNVCSILRHWNKCSLIAPTLKLWEYDWER